MPSSHKTPTKGNDGNSINAVSTPKTPGGTGINRRLIDPSPMIPWSVDVVSLVPQGLVSNLNEYVTGATCKGGWTCLGLRNGQFHVWQNTPFHQSQRQEDQNFQPAKHFVTLYHPDLASFGVGNENVPVIALASSTESESVFCYIGHPTGILMMWKISRKDLYSVSNANNIPPDDLMDRDLQDIRPCAARVHINLELNNGNEDGGYDSTPVNKNRGERLTSIGVEGRQTIVLGTSLGNIYWITQTNIPIGLHVQKVEPIDRSWGLQNYLFGAGKNTRRKNDGSPVRKQLFLSSNSDQTEFMSISEKGSVFCWTMTPSVASSHYATFDVEEVLSLLSELKEHQNIGGVEMMDKAEVLDAAFGGDSNNMLQAMLRTSASIEGGDSRLYWLRLRRQKSSNDKSSTFEWIDAHWLNRFPAPQDVLLMGMVIAENGIAYSSFHLMTGGQLSTVIVMALMDNPHHEQDREDGTNSSSSDKVVDPIIMKEIDLPYRQIPSLLPNTLIKDVVTHGCTMLASSGLGIRVRVATEDAHLLQYRPQKQQTTDKSANQYTKNPATINTLVSHLQSTFFVSYNHANSTNIRLPPSLKEAHPLDLEDAIVTVATNLQKKNVVGGGMQQAVSLDLFEWHQSYIRLLQQSGIYRSLSPRCKWRLLSIGQEIVVYLEILTQQNLSSPLRKRMERLDWEQEHMSSLQSYNIAEWLNGVSEDTLLEPQNNFSGKGYPPKTEQLWNSWMSIAVDLSMSYRYEKADMYDIYPEKIPEITTDGIGNSENGDISPVWTSHSSLQKVFLRQIKYWSVNVDAARANGETTDLVIQAALQSFADTAESLRSTDSKKQYADIKSLAVLLLRRINGMGEEKNNEDLAFELSVKHAYFDGICQIAFDHECRPDHESFKLESLFDFFSDNAAVDYETGLAFGPFVLQWHVDRELLGHTMKYGMRNCPDVLRRLTASDERLRSYQWIQPSYHGDYAAAAECLISNSDTLEEAKWSLSMAKLTNHIVMKESSSLMDDDKKNEAVKRHKRIENQLELIKAQEILFQTNNRNKTGVAEEGEEARTFGDDMPLSLLSTEELLTISLEKSSQAILRDREGKEYNNQTNNNEILKFCLVGLAVIATTTDDTETQQRSAARFWCNSLHANSEMWDHFVARTQGLFSIKQSSTHNYDDFDRERNEIVKSIMEESVFGRLLQECFSEKRLESVRYGGLNNKIIEDAVFDLMKKGDNGSITFPLYNETRLELIRQILASCVKNNNGFFQQ